MAKYHIIDNPHSNCGDLEKADCNREYNCCYHHCATDFDFKVCFEDRFSQNDFTPMNETDFCEYFCNNTGKVPYEGSKIHTCNTVDCVEDDCKYLDCLIDNDSINGAICFYDNFKSTFYAST